MGEVSTIVLTSVGKELGVDLLEEVLLHDATRTLLKQEMNESSISFCTLDFKRKLHLLPDLGWVDYDLRCSIILLRQ